MIALLIAVSVFSVAQQTTNEKPAPAPESTAFNVGDANAVLAQVREALEGHSPRKFLAIIAADKMGGYVSFRDQMEAFYSRYDNIRVNIRSIQTSSDGDKGIITASFQMETTPRSGNVVRREDQLRIELERTDKGWRIVELNPRSFFQ